MKPILLSCALLACLSACDKPEPGVPGKKSGSQNQVPSAAEGGKLAREIDDALKELAKTDPIEVGDSGVIFSAPAEFKPLTKEVIATKWPTDRAPACAIGTPTGTTTIAYDLKPHVIPQDGLQEVQKSFTQLFGRMIPGLDWKQNEIIEHSGRKWLLMEMTSHAVDTDIHNIMMLTGVDQRMLVFNFNSTREEFPRYEAVLRASMKTIKLPKE